MTLLKTIVAGLALTNAAYFLWTHGIGEPAAGSAAASSMPQLRLASEGLAPAARNATTGSDTAADGGASNALPTSGDAGTTVAAPATILARCVSIGPFKDVTEAAHAAATLRGGGYNPRQRGAEGEVWAGVWVYLTIPQNKNTADQMRAKLKAGGIDDALDMPGPNDTPVVSLGLYSETKRAQVRVAQAQSLGLNPGLADRKRTGNVYWIDVDLKPADGALNPSDLQSDPAHNTHFEVKACPSPSAPR